LFLNLFIVLTSEQLLLPVDDSAEDSRHDGFISQQMQFPPETEAGVEPVQEEIAVPAVNININNTMTVPSG
jgi:hypothetical protein